MWRRARCLTAGDSRRRSVEKQKPGESEGFVGNFLRKVTHLSSFSQEETQLLFLHKLVFLPGNLSVGLLSATICRKSRLREGFISLRGKSIYLRDRIFYLLGKSDGGCAQVFALFLCFGAVGWKITFHLCRAPSRTALLNNASSFFSNHFSNHFFSTTKVFPEQYA